MGIFARVLQEVLTAHQDTDYSHLGGYSPRTDPLWHPLRRMAIPPEVINRLKAAAASENRRATLNPDDLDYVSDQLGFTLEERRKLQAALLAQGVEMFLHDRMAEENSDTVAEIAHQVYAQMLTSFQSAYNKVRGDDDEASPLDRALALADRAASMTQAAAAAKTRGSTEMERFWLVTAIAGYEEVVSAIRPLEPELAAEFSTTLLRLKRALEG